jgi:CIC family chloride channel protein
VDGTPVAREGGDLVSPSTKEKPPESPGALRASADRFRRRLRVGARSTWRANRLLAYAVLVGILGAVGARVFIWMLEWGGRIFLGGIVGYTAPSTGTMYPAPPYVPWTIWLIPVSTTLGGLICGLLVYTFAPEAEGHGTDAAIASYLYRGSLVRPIVPLIKAVASSITIGSGGAAGREGPAAQIGSGATSVFCQILGLPIAERRLLVLAGMAAGLAAIFRAPLGMAIFAAEVLYSGVALEYEVLPYSLVAAVVSYAVNGFFVGWSPLFLLPSSLTFNHPLELAAYAVLGVLAGIVGVIEPPIFYGVRDAFRRLRIPNHVKPAVGGLLMGLIGMVFPATLATGFGWVQMAMTADFIGHQLIFLVFAKILAMSVTVSSGGSGGVFGPNVYIGAMLGGWVAYVVNLWTPHLAVAPAAFVVVGMGAVFGGTARVPLSTLIMVAEMTGGYGLIVPSMLATTLSFLVQRAIGSNFRYSRLYESQVEGRLDSPVHQRRLVRGVLRILEQQSAKDLGQVSLPDLSRLLRLGGSIGIHDGQGRIFSCVLAPGEGSLVGKTWEQGLAPGNGTRLVAVIRDGAVLAPDDAGRLQEGDSLILAGDSRAYSEFLKTRGGDARP